MLTKRIIYSAFLIGSLISLDSCGVLWGGELTSCQTAKPIAGRRQIRKAVLVADILVFPLIMISLPVDFKTGAIYKPCSSSNGRGYKY